jgi:hypothetical protein
VFIYHPVGVGKEALIAFFCMKAEHRAAHNGSISDHLTVTDGLWAYCARDARLVDHEWEPTGGISVHEVERFARSRDTRGAREAEVEPDVNKSPGAHH